MISPCEIAANALNAASIILAGRNSVHTWWTGILGCALFGVLFFSARLYADVTLQSFFIVTSICGWWGWMRGDRGAALPVRLSRWTAVGKLFGNCQIYGGYLFLPGLTGEKWPQHWVNGISIP